MKVEEKKKGGGGTIALVLNCVFNRRIFDGKHKQAMGFGLVCLAKFIPHSLG